MTTATRGRSGGIVPEIKTHQRLVIARQEVDLTQAELAERLGVTTSTVQRAESGLTKPRRTTLMAWSLATGVDLHWLETGEAPAPNGPDGGFEVRHQGLEPRTRWLSAHRPDLHECGTVRRLSVIPAPTPPPTLVPAPARAAA